MSRQDRQKLSILIVLLGVLLLTLVLGYRMNKQPVVTAAVQAPETKPSANPPAPADARIRLDLVEKPEKSLDEFGRKNVFQYRETPAPPPPRGGSPARVPQPSTPGMGGLGGPVPNQPPATIAPPGPPPIPFKYQGYALDSSPGGQITAFLTDDTRHYNVGIGEILMGRYRITQISANSVEVEDIDNNRRQMVPVATK
jgi:hypothetical protein